VFCTSGLDAGVEAQALVIGTLLAAGTLALCRAPKAISASIPTRDIQKNLEKTIFQKLFSTISPFNRQSIDYKGGLENKRILSQN
jgi:hypothetical protein